MQIVSLISQGATPFNPAGLQSQIDALAADPEGAVRVFPPAIDWSTINLEPGETLRCLSSSGNWQNLTINNLPSTITDLWVDGRRTAWTPPSFTLNANYAEVAIDSTRVLVRTQISPPNLRWSDNTTPSTVYPEVFRGAPNAREWLRRYQGRLQYYNDTAMTGSQYLTDAQTNPLSNYMGPNGVNIPTEPILDTIYFYAPTLTVIQGALNASTPIPTGTYVASILGTTLNLRRIA